VVRLQDHDFPEHLFYDIENQIWYALLDDGTLRAGFTSWAAALMGEILVFTPKRIGVSFEKDRWFAMVEGGKWVGSARAAFSGVVAAHNDRLERMPELLNQDPFGEGWMLLVRPVDNNWSDSLVTGPGVTPAFQAWLSSGVYKDRAD
jgi:glycine cleavage system H protein